MFFISILLVISDQPFFSAPQVFVIENRHIDSDIPDLDLYEFMTTDDIISVSMYLTLLR